MLKFKFRPTATAGVACCLLGLLAVEAREAVAQEHGLVYPDTPRQELVEQIHGQAIADPYRWLEPNESAAVKAWAAAQNDVTERYLDTFPGRDILKARLTDLFEVPWVGSPYFRGGRAFYHAQPKGVQKDILYWREEGDKTERVLIDPNKFGNRTANEPDENIALGRWSLTRDGRTIAYVLKPNNADEGWIEVMDVESGKVSARDRLVDIKHSRIEWTLDGEGFYYTRLPNDPAIPETDRPGLAEVRFHTLGTPQSQDTLVFPATNDPTTFLRPRVSWDGRWLFIYAWKGWTGVTVYLRDLESDDPSFRTFYRSDNARIWVFEHQGYFYIHTNEDAPNKKLLRVKAGVFDATAWEEVIPESATAVLREVHPSRSRMLAVYLEDVQHKLQIFDYDGKYVRDVALPAPGTARWIKSNPERDDAYFTFSSFTIPWTTYRLSMTDGATDLWSRSDVPFDVGRYQVRQEWFTSRDGTAVPMFIVRDPAQALDGETPVLLTGYGGFNITFRPNFWSSIQPWLEAGGGFAVANIRGGGEFGEAWHRSGMRKNKQNSFDDFIAAAEFLIDKGYTKPDRLAIRGRSNGGLLVTTAMTQRPDLFGAVIAGVPLTDMVRYTAFGVGKTWIEEYGDPALADDFKVLAAYSPYHNVKAGTRYPPILITTADTDDRVHPGHARKFAAMLQAAKPSENLVLLSVEPQAGHGGAGRIADKARNWARELSFLMKQFGMRPRAYTSP